MARRPPSEATLDVALGEALKMAPGGALKMAPGEALNVALGLVQRDGRWFLQRRSLGNSVLPGRWEFPGGKVGPGEPIEAALRRELREELGWEPAGVLAFAPMERTHADGIVRLHPFVCEGRGDLKTDLAWGWFRLYEVGKLPIPEANLALLDTLLSAFPNSLR